MSFQRRITPPHLEASTGQAKKTLSDLASQLSLRQVETKDRDLILNTLDEALFRQDRNMGLSRDQEFSLEALVLLEGRPALETNWGQIDFYAPQALNFSHLALYSDALTTMINSVGRIELSGQQIGTGFVIAPSLILTNRHVAELIAKAYRMVDQSDIWILKAGEPIIDFGREANSQKKQCHFIRSIRIAGPDPINMQYNPKLLDAAILEIEPISIEGIACPPPVTVMSPTHRDAKSGGEIISIGYPASPQFEPANLPSDVKVVDVLDALKRTFNLIYGVKRASPGRILAQLGRINDGNRGWVFSHDASTLGGASGSLVVKCQDGQVLGVGLHFAGEILKANYAHGLGAINGSLGEVMTY